MRPGRGALPWLALAQLSCGGNVAPSEHDGRECSRPLAPEVVAHACQHGTLGPFEDVVAGHGGGRGPLLSSTHVAYRVSWTAAEGALRLVSARSGRHALLHDGGVAVLGMATSSGDVAFSRVEETTCESLPRGVVFRAAAGEEVLVTLRTSSKSGRLFLEHLDTFGDPFVGGCGMP